MNNNYIIYLGMILVIFCWVITPFFRKSALVNINSFDLFLITQSIVMIYVALIVIFLKLINDYSIPSIENLSKKEILYILAGSMTTVISSIVLIWLLKHNEATYIMPQLQPAVLVLTLIIGTCIFNEKITSNKIIGIILIIFGIYSINKTNVDR